MTDLTCPPGYHVESVCVADPIPVPAWTDLGSVPAIAASPTALGRVICQLHPWGGRVWLGYGDWNDIKQPGCDLIAYDPAAGGFVTVTHIATDALWSLRTVGADLWALATDPEVGADPDAVIVRPDGSSRVLTGGRSPYPWHLFDAVQFNGRSYLAGADRAPGTDCATVWRNEPQTTGADMWPAVWRKTGVGRCYALWTLGGSLYAASSDGTVVKSTDGLTWSAAPGSRTNLPVKPLAASRGVFYRSGWPAFGTGVLYLYDGRAVSGLGTVQDHHLDGDTLWTLAGGVVWRDGVAVTDAPAGAVSLCVLDGAVYAGTTDAHLWRFG